MIKRERYIEKMREFYESDLIKLIAGVKHSGKSVILSQIMEEIKEKSDNVLYLDFGDRRVSSNIKSAEALVGYVEKNGVGGKQYIFLDEIDTLNGWQEACKTLRGYGHSLFAVVSSNDAFDETLGDAYISFRIRPFVYKELLEYAEELGREVTVEDYLIWGGFPKRLELDGADAKRRYLDELDGAIMNDLIRRHKIRKEGLFLSFADFALRSNGKIFSEKAIHDHITEKEGSCSINTIMKYLDIIENAYLVDSIKQYSNKLSRELVFYTKLYNADVASNSVRCMDEVFDTEANFQNIIYNELIYMGYDVSAYDNGGKKIDILARKGNDEYFIQTVYGAEKSEGELAESFRGLGATAKKVVMTYGDVDISVNGASCIRLDEFLRMESLDEIVFEAPAESVEKKVKAKTSVKIRKTKTEKTENKEKESAEQKPETKKKVPFYQIF